MIDDEKLILLVQKKDEIYNKYNPYYKFVDKKKEAWMDIANEMDTTEDEVVKRWTSLRDRFTRECKKRDQMSESEALNMYRWPYFDMMEFIRPHIKSRYRGIRKITKMPKLEKMHSPTTSPTNFSQSSSNLSTKSSPIASPAASPRKSEQITHVLDDPLIDSTLLYKTKETNSDVDKIFIEAVEIFKKTCTQNETRHTNPAVHAFGEMIVTTICSMNRRNQIKAMQQVTDLVMRIKLEEDELLESVSYSTL